MVGHAPGGYKTVELDVDIGSSAFDYAAIQKSEVSLSPPQARFLILETKTN